MQWTNDQLKAIEATKGTLLVSAAAGSGKTAVLVERVIRRISDSENPCGIDSLLIVTFTKAAAAQMRERISAALAELIAKNPSDTALQRQQLLLPFAKISTIDSFCNDLVRKHFHLTDIGPDFNILGQSEAAVMKAEAADLLMEELYADESEGARNLVELLIERGGNEKTLRETVVGIYEQARAHPFEEDFYNELLEPYLNVKAVEKSAWGKIIRQNVLESYRYCAEQTEGLLNEIAFDNNIFAAYSPALTSDLAIYTELVALAENGGWDELLQAVRDLMFARLNPCRECDEFLREKAKNKRDNIKKTAQKARDIIPANSDEHLEDMAWLLPVAQKFVETLKSFANKYDAIKAKGNFADFSDVMHMAINLLVERDECGKPIKTPLAIELSKTYTEILVDEYQDINKAQDMIFSAISRNEKNLFFVGDVKQSIYRFRNAMPEIFLNRRASLPLYEAENYPARVILGKNFRSRRGVTGMVNFVFSQLMSEEAGDVNYDEGEELVPAADYPPLDEAEVQLHIINSKEAESEKEDETKDDYQAGYIAELINKMIKEGLSVSEKGKVRPARYSDFCILLRSIRNKASVYVEQLSRRNIPAYSELSGGFFEAKEVAFILSLLRILDNPLQDVPLLSVMLSPVFGFSPDELALMRSQNKRVPLYHSLLESSKGGNEKSAAFLMKMQQLRRLASTLSAGELVRRLLEETGYIALAGAMEKGPKRRANLLLLLEYAGQYEAAGHIGLAGFIRFIDRLKLSEEDLAPAVELPETANVVRVMSVHKSKGLEFPICILADCNKGFNLMDSQKTAINSFGLGMGFIRKEEETLRRFETVSSVAVKLDSKQKAKAEEMRILYVAMTRAKEQLIMVTDLDKPENKLAALAQDLSDTKISGFSVLQKGSFSDWILMTSLRHPDARALRELAGEFGFPLKEADFRLSVFVEGEKAEEKEEEDRAEESLDEQLLKDISERLAYRYPYESLSKVVAKRAASDLDYAGMQKTYFASSKPAFLSEEKLTAAQKGTAVHRFMEFADYEAASLDVEKEADRLVSQGFLSLKEAKSIDLEKIRRFFASDLAKRIFESKQVMREKKFTIRVEAEEIYPKDNLPPEVAKENVIIQGIIDCAFKEDGELVLLDYKTDRVSNSQELIDKYYAQLAIYKKALEMITGLPVKESYVYSFSLGKGIKVTQKIEK